MMDASWSAATDEETARLNRVREDVFYLRHGREAGDDDGERLAAIDHWLGRCCPLPGERAADYAERVRVLRGLREFTR